MAALGVAAQRRVGNAEHVVVRGIEHDGRVEDVHVLVPAGRRAPGSLAVVVALHGRAEARRGPLRGALGWLEDYGLERVFAAFEQGRLGSEHLAGMVVPEQARAISALLRRHPFRGVLAVVMPYTPDLTQAAPGAPEIGAFGRWLVEEMLPRVRHEVPALASGAAQTGIDGVSLGGMLALEIGLRNPEQFGSVGGIQPAVQGRIDPLAELARGWRGCLRLASSDRDPFLGPTRALAAAWRASGVQHELVEYRGPHGYAFNRGPGAIELLRFHHACFSGRAPTR